MKTNRLWPFAFVFAFPALLSGTSVDGGSAPCLTINLMSIAARTEATRPVALRVLTQMARGDGSPIEPSVEKELALPQGYTPKSALNLPVIRSCAIRSLGKTGLPEAVEFLKSITLADAGADPHVIWTSVQIALREAVLTGIHSPHDRAVFLEGVLREHHDNVSNVAVNNWAITTISDEGLSEAWPTGRNWLKKMWGGDPGGEDEIRDLEARVQIAARDTNRVRALGSVFDSFVQMAGNREGYRLLDWAVGTLIGMHTAEADAELDRIYAQLQDGLKQFPDDVPARQFAKLIKDSEASRTLYSSRPFYNR
jgi:hypothetical protein